MGEKGYYDKEDVLRIKGVKRMNALMMNREYLKYLGQRNFNRALIN